MNQNPTIAAISTASGPGGIAIVRLSGPNAHAILDRLFVPHRPRPVLASHRLYYGCLVDPARQRPVDQVMAVRMAAPATYTREDVAEIHCHGGPVAARTVLAAAIQAGARPAEPGEFTRRAFLNGRIDLTQAEAVAEMIQAQSSRQAELAARQLAGDLTRRFDRLRTELIDLLGQLEVALDFPEEDVEIVAPEILARRLDQAVLRPLDELIQEGEAGRYLREGMVLALVGRPNVGKSSLVNALLKTDRCIVTPTPGTTRDVIEAETRMAGLPVVLVDTAGMGQRAGDDIEAEGQRRAQAQVDRADFVLLVVDGSQPVDAGDRLIWDRCPVDRRLLVLNKTDLPAAQAQERVEAALGAPVDFTVSALTGQGVDILEKGLIQRLETEKQADTESVPPNSRHLVELKNARDVLSGMMLDVESGATYDVLAFQLREALDALDRITGASASEDVLNHIFERFCLGK
jgi:tRNA modification GTPase